MISGTTSGAAGPDGSTMHGACTVVDGAQIVEEDHEVASTTASTAQSKGSAGPDAWADAAEAARAAKMHVDVVLGFVAPCVMSYSSSLRPWSEFAILMMQT